VTENTMLNVRRAPTMALLAVIARQDVIAKILTHGSAWVTCPACRRALRRTTGRRPRV
jgi:hypothetical protein